jgi:L-lactate dehydrogenase complex protein LldE
MRVGLFIPCYIDALYPEVGIATLELLERLGISVEYPFDQTCCGQPMANTGCEREAAAAEALFVRCFERFDQIVIPSGSCTHQVRDHFDAIAQTQQVRHVRTHTWELVEFLHDVLKVEAFPWAEFPHRVGIHIACNTLRALGQASLTEINTEAFSKPRDLLAKVRGIEFVEPARSDECCGFGGAYSVYEPEVSVATGLAKVRDHAQAGAEYIVSADMSCLMHQEGCARHASVPVRFLHIAQVLNGARA